MRFFVCPLRKVCSPTLASSSLWLRRRRRRIQSVSENVRPTFGRTFCLAVFADKRILVSAGYVRVFRVSEQRRICGNTKTIFSRCNIFHNKVIAKIRDF